LVLLPPFELPFDEPPDLLPLLELLVPLFLLGIFSPLMIFAGRERARTII
jgi:hypothetical protein